MRGNIEAMSGDAQALAETAEALRQQVARFKRTSSAPAAVTPLPRARRKAA